MCDYPECGRDAVWKVELSDNRRLPQTWDWGSSITFSGDGKRTSVDACGKHLVRVSFDPDEIAEFTKGKAAAR
jgi:hypothetical protein